MRQFPLLRLLFVILALLLAVSAAHAQDEDGIVIHTVATGETFDAIAFRYGLTRQELLALNPDVTNIGLIQIGQQLIVDAPDPTATPPPTPAPTQPSAVELAAPAPIRSAANGEVLPPMDPALDEASICVLLFDDRNQNRIREADEPQIEGGQISLSGTSEATHTTNGAPHCFAALGEGVYTVAAVVPDSYGLTTPPQFQVEAVPGVSVQVLFGAAQGVSNPPRVVSSGVMDEITVSETPPRAASPLLDNLGLIAFGLAGIVLVGGLGVSLLLRRR
jgi:LysM repeat protein